MSNKKLLLALLLIMSLFIFTACSNSDNTEKDDETQSVPSNASYAVNFTAFGSTGEKLSDVTFEILKDDITVESVVTDSLGNATSKLQPGKYCYTILSVPDGYVTDDIMYEFNVSTQETEIEVEIAESAN